MAAILADEPGATAWHVGSRLTWTGGWDRLARGVMLYSALLQTDMYRDFVVRGGRLDDASREPDTATV